MSTIKESDTIQEENNSLLHRDSTINEAKNLILMKKGDYSVHILVEEE